MTKPWEETWEYIGHYQHVDVPEGGDIGIFVDDRILDRSETARLVLAASSPDMARVLLAVEWGGGMCPSCGGTRDRHEDDGHADGCALDACLTKAGVR